MTTLLVDVFIAIFALAGAGIMMFISTICILFIYAVICGEPPSKDNK